MMIKTIQCVDTHIVETKSLRTRIIPSFGTILRDIRLLELPCISNLDRMMRLLIKQIRIKPIARRYSNNETLFTE